MPQPTFRADALVKLSERTEYEAWFLEAVYSLIEQELFPSWPDGVVYPADGSKVLFFGYGRGNGVICDWRSGFLNAGAPLVFVSTFKLLDMLIEWILEENGVPSKFRFQEKVQHLKNSPVFPAVIETRSWLKERLIGFYRTLEPLRGTIIHDKHFTSADGAIQISRSKKGIIGSPVDITAARLRKLACTIMSILRYIDGTWHLDELREKILRHDLDELIALHGLPSLGQKLPFHTCVRVYLKASDPFLVDLMPIRNDLDARYANQDCSFDLRVLLVRDDSVFDAYLFPWSLFAVPSSDWSRTIDAQQYRTAAPDDIELGHLRSIVG
ncbi:MAG: hypothetical protein WBN82_03730 [Porticoccaceae bacterium]